MRYCFGVDVGGTTVKLGFFDEEGNLLEKWEIPTRTEDHGKNILPDVAASILDKMKEREVSREEIAGVGIGAPGPIDAKGTVYVAVNLGWGTFSLKNELQSLLNLPVEAGNDANVAALGEMWKGGGQGYSNVVAVTLGTGVGGGIIINGKIVTGAHGAAGEIGHANVEPYEEAVCNCGNHGCLEQMASATGIVRLARIELEKSPDASVLRDGELSAKSIFDAFKAGDSLAAKIVDRFAEYLGHAMAFMSAVVDPEVFVIGGGVSKAGEVLVESVKKYYQRDAFTACKDTPIVLAKLGNDAGIYGAAKLALEA